MRACVRACVRVTCSNEISHMSANLILRKYCLNIAQLIFDDFDYAKYSDYVAIIAINNLQDIFDNERDLGGYLEYIKRCNRSKTAKFGMTTHSTMYLLA